MFGRTHSANEGAAKLFDQRTTEVNVRQPNEDIILYRAGEDDVQSRRPRLAILSTTSFNPGELGLRLCAHSSV